MAPIKALNKVKLKLEYNKYYKITKKFFSKDGQITNESGLVDAIADEVIKDSKVKYVENNFEIANQLGYGNIFWGYSNAHDFFKKCSLKTWITKFTGPNNLICGRTASEYGNIGYSSEKRGKYWYIWLIGKEIRKLAQIAADGIKKNKQADEDFSPKWQFISTPKMNDVAKAMSSKVTMASAAIEAAAKATKIDATAKEPQRDEQNSQTQNSTFGNKSKIIPNERSLRNSVVIAEGISDEKNKFSLKKSLSRLSFNRSKKSKDDTSKPNQRGLKNLREKYKLKKVSKEKISSNKDIQIIERCLEYDWSKEYKNKLQSSNNALDYLKSDFTNDDINDLLSIAKNCIEERLKYIRENAQKNDKKFLKQKSASDNKFNEFKEEYKEKWLNIFKYCKDNQDNYDKINDSIHDCLDYVGPPTRNKNAIFKIEGQYVYNNFFENREYLTSVLGSREEQRMLSALDDAKTPFIDASKNIERLYSGTSNLDLVVTGLTSWEKSVKEIMERAQKLFEYRVEFTNNASKYINEAYDKVKEAEEQTIKNENTKEDFNQTEKSFSKESRSKIEELMKKSDDGSLQENDRKTLLDLLEHKELSGETLTKKEKTELDNLLHAKGLKTKEEVEALSDNEFLDYLME